MSKSEPPPAKKLTPVERKKITGKNRVSAALEGMTLIERDDLKRAFESNRVGPPTSKSLFSQDENGQIVVRDKHGIWMAIFSSEEDFYRHLENSREAERRAERGRPRGRLIY